MTPTLLLDNVFAYSLQVLAVIAAAALVLLLVRSGAPRVRMAVWQALLLLCLLLPVMQPWPAADDTDLPMISLESGPVALASEGQSNASSFDWRVAILLLLGLGVVVRLSWLVVGLYRLRRHRLQAQPMEITPSIEDFGKHIASAGFSSSGAIRSPVTFGVWRPVVLLPLRFKELETDVQRAVVCHELLHVQRRDWLFTVAEEVVRAVLWFHPAIWWLISQIQLTREQVVDREALDWTGSREPYVEALLAISGADAQLDLAPAPLFLRKHHLNWRVEALLQEKTMSKQSIAACLGLLVAIVTGVTWLVMGAFPLVAAPQTQEAVARPTVEIAEQEPLLHRTSPRYPAAAREKGVEGKVDLEISIDENGNVNDARVINGPAELRSTALQAVLGWHYSEEADRPSQRLVTLNFRLPPEGERRPRRPLPDEEWGVIESIDVGGLADVRREALLADLPVQVGDMLSESRFTELRRYVDRFDEHLRLAFTGAPIRDGQGSGTAFGKLAIRIFLPRGQVVHGEPAPAKEIRPSGVVQSARLTDEIPNVSPTFGIRLIERVPPRYPPLARQAGVEGTVFLMATIGEEGAVEKLEVEAGHPLLVPAALEAVKQWRYTVATLNGDPVKVQTQLDINFRLSR